MGARVPPSLLILRGSSRAGIKTRSPAPQNPDDVDDEDDRVEAELWSLCGDTWQRFTPSSNATCAHEPRMQSHMCSEDVAHGCYTWRGGKQVCAEKILRISMHGPAV